MARTLFSSIEPLESRIAPASLSVLHPLPNIIEGLPGAGASHPASHTIDLGNMFDANGNYDTFVTFTTTYDTDPNTPGIQAGVFQMELFDSLAPATVANFLSYINGPNGDEYLNTFFSRDAFLDQAKTIPFVLQGGGYSAGTDASPTPTNQLGNHIAEGPTVHNEFGISNTLGTVAMAKTGLGPNTATSEFFINLGDNSANLDHQNGGFTVFGKIVSGMDVINEIAALPQADMSSATHSGALTTVPYQGTLPASGVPATSQLIKFESITTSHTNGSSPAYTYSVQEVGNSTTNLPATSGVLATTTPFTYNAQTQALTLNYSGKAGVATIEVIATDSANNHVTEDFTVTVLPNLIVDATSDTLQSIVSEGNTGLATFKITNNGAVNASGAVDVNVYLVPSGTPPLAINPATSILLGTTHDGSLNLDPGKSTTLTANLKIGIPTLQELAANGDYQIVEQVTSTGITELFSDDKSSVDGATHSYYNVFGSFATGFNSKGQLTGKHINVPFSYFDSAGDLITLNYKGDGAAVLVPNGDGAPSIVGGYLNELHGNASTAALTLKIAQGNATTAPTASTHTTFQDIDLQSIGKISLGNADITGNVDIAGAASVTLGNLLGDGTATDAFTLHIGDSKLVPAVQLGSVTNYNFTADSKVKSLAAANWVVTTASPELISAPALGSLNIAGTLQDNVTISAVTQSATPLLKTFTVGGSLSDSIVQIGGNVGNVMLGSMDQSDFLVGVAITTGTPVIPAHRTDFASPQSIASFVINGSSASVDKGMIASTVAATDFGYIYVTKVDPSTTTETSAFGFVADTIAKYQRQPDTGTLITLKNLPYGNNDSLGEYGVQILAPTTVT